MARKPSPAQRAVQITFVLKGHLKNAQISYLRVAAGLAEIRDERLYAALKHDSLESYAAERLGLGRASVYRYMQIHDWVREFHPGWLAKKPKGFIPELTDAYALMWIDHRLASEKTAPALRRDLERLRKKALAGELSLREFQEVQKGTRPDTPPLRALVRSLRTARRKADAVPGLPASVVREIDALVARVDALSSASRQTAKIVALAERRSRVELT